MCLDVKRAIRSRTVCERKLRRIKRLLLSDIASSSWALIADLMVPRLTESSEGIRRRRVREMALETEYVDDTRW